MSIENDPATKKERPKTPTPKEELLSAMENMADFLERVATENKDPDRKKASSIDQVIRGVQVDRYNISKQADLVRGRATDWLGDISKLTQSDDVSFVRRLVESPGTFRTDLSYEEKANRIHAAIADLQQLADAGADSSLGKAKEQSSDFERTPLKAGSREKRRKLRRSLANWTSVYWLIETPCLFGYRQFAKLFFAIRDPIRGNRKKLWGAVWSLLSALFLAAVTIVLVRLVNVDLVDDNLTYWIIGTTGIYLTLITRMLLPDEKKAEGSP